MKTNGLAPKENKTNKSPITGEQINYRLNDFMEIPRYRRPKEVGE